MVHQVIKPKAAHERRQRRRVMTGPVRDAAADYAGLQPVVDPRAHDRVLEAGHHDDVVDELVVRAAPAPQFVPQRALLRLAQVLHHQDLEVGPGGRGLLRGRARVLVRAVPTGRARALAVPVGFGDQGPVDPADHRREPVVRPGREQPPHLLEALPAGKRPEPLDRREAIQQAADGPGRRVGRAALVPGQDQLSARLLQAGPAVVPELPQAVVGQRLLSDGHGPTTPVVLHPSCPIIRSAAFLYHPPQRSLATSSGPA